MTARQLLNAALANEKIRFLLVGCVNTLLDFLLLNFFTFGLGLFYVISNIFSVMICIVVSYLLNHYFVFQKKGGVTLWSFLTFFAVTGFSSLALQSIIITGAHWALGTPFSRSLFIVGDFARSPVLELNATKAVAVAIGMIWNFLFYKRLVFRRKPTETDSEFIG